ncbi:MAG: hypothetical protein ABS81_02895 [Pseudonocardia sp. SCN 72-86]|nr:MAG: hypothetical protein ABS81_02895 [Pseudonocardia sp. SCN 72-86]
MTEFLSDNQTFINVLVCYALVAFSIQVALRAGCFSLAGVGFYGIASYGAAIMVKAGVPAVVAIAITVASCAVVGWLFALILVRLKDLYLGLATVAFVLMVSVVAVNWTSVTGGASGLYAIPASVSPLAMVLLLVGVIVLLALLERGTIGRTFEATREDEQLAMVMGIDPRRYRRFAFALSAALGGLSGALHALTFFAISPTDAGFPFIVLALAMVIIGGFGSWMGALIGALIIAWLPLQLAFLGQWWPVIYGATMIVIATYLPGGLHALVKRALARRRSKQDPPVESSAELVGATSA